MGIDNMEVVNICNDKEWRQMPSRACARNVDLRLQLEALAEKYEGELVVSHVKAHQDDDKPYHELTFEGKRNTYCDVVAKGEIARIEKGADKISRFRTETKVMIWSEEGGLAKNTYAWCMEKLAIEILRKQLKLHVSQFRMVDWPLHGKALSLVERRYMPSVLKNI